jgi:hypothetical protein
VIFGLPNSIAAIRRLLWYNLSSLAHGDAPALYASKAASGIGKLCLNSAVNVSEWHAFLEKKDVMALCSYSMKTDKR